MESNSTRINKYLKDRGVATRKHADELIRKKLVLINGRVAVLGDKVSPHDNVEVLQKKKPVYTYLAYHKPKGISTTHDGGGLAIADVIKHPNKKLFPVGRLDKESTGLIILTDDGRITDRLLNPDKKHEKEYRVTVDRQFSPAFAKHMSEGVMLGGEKTRPAKFKKISDTAFSLVLTEGKNRQIRRMTEVLGYTVRELKRTRIQNIMLGKLPAGAFKEIVGKEQQDFLTSLGL